MKAHFLKIFKEFVVYGMILERKHENNGAVFSSDVLRRFRRAWNLLWLNVGKWFSVEWNSPSALVVSVVISYEKLDRIETL